MKFYLCLVWLISWLCIPAILYEILFSPHYGVFSSQTENLIALTLYFVTAIIGIVPLAFKLAIGTDDVIVDKEKK
jgi:hypothetical protein